MFLELYFTVSATPCMTEVYYILMQSIVVQLQVTVYHDTQYTIQYTRQRTMQQTTIVWSFGTTPQTQSTRRSSKSSIVAFSFRKLIGFRMSRQVLKMAACCIVTNAALYGFAGRLNYTEQPESPVFVLCVLCQVPYR